MNRKLTFYGLAVVALFVLSTFAMVGTMPVSATTQTKSNPTQTRTDQWIEDLQANYNNPSWFYTHLNTTDRLMIRNAFDYATPRDAIINSIMNGFGKQLATYAVPQEGAFAFGNVTPVRYNLNTAKSLLAKVFGYTWSHTDNTSTPYDESAPYFPITLMVPNSNPSRVQWANLMQGIFTSIGIGSTLVEFSFTNIINRVFGQPANQQGYDFAHGGFDSLFIGWGGGTFPDDGSQWYQSGYIPNNNYQNVNNTYINYLVAQENNESIGANGRLHYFYVLQNYVNNQSLKQILFQNVAPFIYANGVTGFNPYYAVQGALPLQNMTNNGKGYFTIGSPSKFSSVNPLITNDVYSNYVLNSLWLGGLLAIANPNGDYHNGFTTYDSYMNLASNYTIGNAVSSFATGAPIASLPQQFYNFTLKRGLVFADGSPLTTKDIAFTYKQVLSPNVGAISYGGLAYYMNNESIHVYDNYHIGFNLTTWADPFPFGESLFGLNIMPEVTYGASGVVGNWKSAQSNTGGNFTNNDVTPAQYASVFNGDGPYQIQHIDPSTGYVNLTVSPLWNSALPACSATQAAPCFNQTYVNQFYVPGYNTTPTLKTVAIKVVSDPTAAVSELTSHAVDYVDTNIGLTDVYQSNIFNLVKTHQIQEYNATGAVWQEFALNQASPIWGFSPLNINYATSQSSNTVSVTTTTTSSTSTGGTPFGDIYTIVGAFVAIGVLNFAYRKRKLRK